jgi:hypothetical protein
MNFILVRHFIIPKDEADFTSDVWSSSYKMFYAESIDVFEVTNSSFTGSGIYLLYASTCDQYSSAELKYNFDKNTVNIETNFDVRFYNKDSTKKMVATWSNSYHRSRCSPIFNF